MVWLLLFFSNYLIFGLFLVIPYLWLKKSHLLAFRVTSSAFIAWLASTIIKDYFYFPRPYLLNHHSTSLGIWLDGSFPSGHTALAFAIACSVFFHSQKLGLILFTCSLLISISRIWGNVHTLTDVLAGIVLGCSCAFLTHKIPFRG